VSDADAAPGVIARRLQALWEIRPASLRDVATAISQATGRHVSAAYLGQLKNGTRAEPSYSIIEAIAKYFSVTPDYFSADDDTARHTEDELRLLNALRDSGVRSIALRADGLSPKSLAAIADIVRTYRAAEGLPEAPEPRQARSPACHS
jgi:transcriptional regulator with XRE-family HTH domain